jgi:hypothetical protein
VQPPESAPIHPADELIIRLVRDHEAVATPADVDAIVDRIATAPFNHRPMRVRTRDRGMAYGGIVLGSMADPLDIHLVKRAFTERQWITGTTADEYLADLRLSARHPRAQVFVYERTADICAATISPTLEVVPDRRLGPVWLPHLFVVYSAVHSVVKTAYMYSETSELDLPEAIRWLR